MADGKKITVLLHHSPFCGNFCEEGLRAATGLGQSRENHSVRAVFMGDGVWFALKNSQQRDFLKYVMALKTLGMEMILEQESVETRGLKTEQLMDEFKSLSRAEILKLIKSSNHVISY